MRDLNLPHHAGGIHAGSFVHGIAPDVEDGLSGPDHAAHERSAADAHSQIEVVERVNVHVLKTMAHCHRVIHQLAQVTHVIGFVLPY